MYPLVTWVLVLMAVSWVGGCGPAAFDCIQAGIMRTTRRPNWLPHSPLAPGPLGPKGRWPVYQIPSWPPRGGPPALPAVGDWEAGILCMCT